MGLSNNDDAMNKIPLKSVIDDEEKNGGEFIHDTATAEEARRELRKVNLLNLMKKLTIGIICFIGIALISYVIISLCFSDDNNTATSATSANNTLTNSALAASIVYTTQADTNAAAASDDIATLNITQPADVASATGYNDAATKASVDATATLSTPATTIKVVPVLSDIPILEENFTSTLGVFQHAAMCSDKSFCSKIGSQIMQDGGSAVDAAIASLLCVGITTLQSMGLGGGMLMNIYVKSHKQAFSVDAREVAPFAATQDMFNDDIKLSLHGGLSIAVPGELMGYEKAHSKFGKLPWKKLVEPSLKLCKEGFYMTKHLNAAYTSKFNRTKSNEILSKVFVNETTQKVHPIGTKLYPLTELCSTYELLASNGAHDFYNGTLGRLVAADLKDLGSLVTFDDLESYGADMVSSVTMQLGDDMLHSMPPISSGTIVANALSILEGFNFTQADLLDTERRATVIHRIVEALKFGYAKRWELGDVRYNDVRDLVSRLTNPETGIQLRKLINDTTVLKNVHEYGAQFSEEDDIGTSPLVVMAANGDAVAVTSTINDYFGSGQVGKRTGIIFNSAMNDFSIPGQKNNFNLPPSPSNFIGPQKRPMSSMSPMILTDPKGNVRLAVSAAGGAKIISSIVEVMSRVLWFNQNIKEAIDAPRFHSQLVPNVLEYEKSTFFSEELLKLLADKGHILKATTTPGSVLCGIVRNSTAIYANADYRKRGGIAGY